MILADASAWVEFDRATGSPVHRRVAALVREGGSLAVTEPVIMEVLAGARTDEREAQLRRFLDRFDLLALDAAADFVAAARIYRACRRVGITPRGLTDCLIAAVAHRHEATLLTHDGDIHRVARAMGIALDHASHEA